MTNLHARDKDRYPIETQCRLLGVSKQAYFQRDEDVLMRRIVQEELALSYILEIRKKDPGLGGIKLWHMYKRDFTGNKPMGRDRFETLIDRYGLKLKQRIRKPRTTDSRHSLPVYPNLIKDLIPTAPNQLWVSDITPRADEEPPHADEAALQTGCDMLHTTFSHSDLVFQIKCVTLQRCSENENQKTDSYEESIIPYADGGDGRCRIGADEESINPG